MSETYQQTIDRLSAELNPVPPPEPRSYPGTLPAYTALDPTSPSYEKDKWDRAHEKKRLAAYLKGNPLFAHGRVPAYPVGFRPMMWPVVSKPQQQSPPNGEEGHP